MDEDQQVQFRRDRLREAVALWGAGNQSELARLVGKPPAQIADMIAGRKSFGSKVARQIEAALRAHGKPVSPYWLDGPVNEPATLPLPAGNAQPETIRPYPSGNRIPVVGTAQLGDNGHFVELEYPVGHGDGYVDIASRDPNAYALRCRGDSMKPRIQAGEFVVIEPNQEAVPGDEVLVKAKDGRVMVKRYLYRRDGRVHLLSVNEAHGPTALEESEVEAMHYVAAIVKAARWVTG